MKGYKAVIVLVILTIIAQLFANVANWVTPLIFEALDIYDGHIWLGISTNIIYLVSKLLLLVAYGTAAFGLPQGDKCKIPFVVLAVSCLFGVILNIGNIAANIYSFVTENIPTAWYGITGATSFFTTTLSMVGLIWLAVAVRSIPLRITSIVFAISQMAITLFYIFVSPDFWHYIYNSGSEKALLILYNAVTFIIDFGPELLFFAALIHFAQSLKVRN